MIRIKDWKKFQHFKDRRPPWIKLYRDILDDPDWHSLSGENAKILTMLWLIASDDEEKKGFLPPINKLAFRLRITESKLISVIQALSCWLIQDDIDMISDGCQDDTPEGETERETEGETEFLSDSNEIRLSKLLYSLIKKRSPGHKEPDYQKWGKHIDRMIRLDGRDPQVIANVIGWCQGDDFWQNNILSTNKLRDQFDQLFLKMSDDTGDDIAKDCAPECFNYGTCKALGKLKDGPCGAFTGP